MGNICKLRRKSLYKQYRVVIIPAEMSEEQNKSPLALEQCEKDAFWYIMGVPILIASIVILALLTHVVLTP